MGNTYNYHYDRLLTDLEKVYGVGKVPEEEQKRIGNAAEKLNAIDNDREMQARSGRIPDRRYKYDPRKPPPIRPVDISKVEVPKAHRGKITDSTKPEDIVPAEEYVYRIGPAEEYDKRTGTAVYRNPERALLGGTREKNPPGGEKYHALNKISLKDKKILRLNRSNEVAFMQEMQKLDALIHKGIYPAASEIRKHYNDKDAAERLRKLGIDIDPNDIVKIIKVVLKREKEENYSPTSTQQIDNISTTLLKRKGYHGYLNPEGNGTLFRKPPTVEEYQNPNRAAADAVKGEQPTEADIAKRKAIQQKWKWADSGNPSIMVEGLNMPHTGSPRPNIPNVTLLRMMLADKIAKQHTGSPMPEVDPLTNTAGAMPRIPMRIPPTPLNVVPPIPVLR